MPDGKSSEETAEALTLRAVDVAGRTLVAGVHQDAEKMGTWVGTVYAPVLKAVREANKL